MQYVILHTERERERQIKTRPVHGFCLKVDKGVQFWFKGQMPNLIFLARCDFEMQCHRLIDTRTDMISKVYFSDLGRYKTLHQNLVGNFSDDYITLYFVWEKVK